MTFRQLTLALCAALSISAVQAADTFVNLTPTPKEMTVGTGELTLPSEFIISQSGLTSDMTEEITKFATALHQATGITATQGSESGLISVTRNSALADEGYNLTITADGVQIEAATSAGLYYAFQTIKKIMPANVMAGVMVEGTYTLPQVTIKDEPRYVHRGYELDCARHFFDVAEVKRMLDVMSYYKMNRLHWHLTDDQGWRIEVPKYPKLTGVAATAPNAYWWDFENGYEYYLNEPYGPYYYSVDDMKEVVAYAAERHIEVIPEVDMPGHMQGAIAAYPEFSCNPGGAHTVRYWPGVSTDILDVSNPAVVQFCKDVMDQLIEIFPYEYIHIGGDECPVTAWTNSASCQEMKSRLGLKSDRALQSWLTKELADYVKPQGRRLICWNEVLTADDADKDMVKDADIMIYDWLGGTSATGPSYQAAQLGLRSVWCSTYHYYIDYSQWSGSSEPKSMSGPITLQTIYNVQPSTTSDPALLPYYYGVQCNLWTEYVCEPAHVEYNSLPRMIAVAETGWSPQSKKDFTDFLKRFNADTKLLDLGNYTYGKHYVDNADEPADIVYPTAGKYYRLVTKASADANRKDRCIELVREGSSLITSNSAVVGQLWTNTQAAEGAENYDWQFWTFEADPSDATKFAMVCRAQPDGSVSPDMSGSSMSARWSYDSTAKHYNFVLSDYTGQDGSSYYYSIRSDKGTDWYLNCAQIGQNLTVNNWSAPDDGNGGLWLFSAEDADAPTANPAFTFLTEGETYMLTNATEKFSGVAIADTDSESTLLGHSADEWAANAWTVEATTTDSDLNIQYVTIKNVTTGRYISTSATDATTTTSGTGFFTGNAGYAVELTTEPTTTPAVRIIKNEDTDDYSLSIDDKNLYPLAVNCEVNPGTISSGSTTAGNATRNQGAAWNLVRAKVITYNCIDTEGNAIATYHLATDAEHPSVTEEVKLPTIENYEYVSSETEGDVITVTYKRVAYNVTYVCHDAMGAEVAQVVVPVAIGSTHTVTAPELDYYTFSSIEPAAGTALQPTADVEINAIYTSDAINGVRTVLSAVSELKDGHTYVIYDADPRGGGRNAYRYASDANKVQGSSTCTDASPAYAWVLEATTAGFAVRNLGNGLYIPAVGHGSVGEMTSTPASFTFTYDASTQGWTVQNVSDSECWDGNSDGSMAGWTGGGQPYHFYEYAAAPYFSVSVTEQSTAGTVFVTRSMMVNAGGSYMFATSSRPGYSIKSIEGADDLDVITTNKKIVVTYEPDESGINQVLAPGDAPTGIYDLKGRQLRSISRPGVYIVNGVKMLVK